MKQGDQCGETWGSFIYPLRVLVYCLCLYALVPILSGRIFAPVAGERPRRDQEHKEELAEAVGLESGHGEALWIDRQRGGKGESVTEGRDRGPEGTETPG